MKQIFLMLLLVYSITGNAQIDATYIHTDYNCSPSLNYVNIAPIALTWRTQGDSLKRVYIDVANIAAETGNIPYSLRYLNDSSGNNTTILEQHWLQNVSISDSTTKTQDKINTFNAIFYLWNLTPKQ